MLSFFGYPDAKLSEWGGGKTDESVRLKERLDSFFATVFAIIDRGLFSRALFSSLGSLLQSDKRPSLWWQDLSSGTHLQFAFSGRVPVVDYPLDVLVRGRLHLSMIQ